MSTCDVLEEYYGIYPTSLFLCADNQHKMHFILSLKKMDDRTSNKLLDVMRHCGAKVSLGIEDATEFSAVIADHEDPIPKYNKPVFKIDYIKCCLKELRCLDISDFRQTRTINVAAGVDFMDVVYFRLRTWSSVMLQCMASNESSEEYEEVSGNEYPTSTIRSFEVSSSFDKGKEKGKRPDGMNSPKTNGEVDKDLEDDAIIDSGEDCNMAKPSTSSGATKWRFDDGISSDDSVQEDPVALSTRQRKNSTEKISQRTVSLPSSSDESVPAEPEVHHKSREQSYSKNTSSKHTRLESTYRNPYNKHTRAPYTHEDRCVILKYIVKNNEHTRVKGRDLWIVMERRKLLPTRTWQSMKEHFLKKIVVDLDCYPFLTSNDKLRLKCAGL